MKRPSAVEPIIGRVKAENRTNRYYLNGRDGDRINAVPAAPCTGSRRFCAHNYWASVKPGFKAQEA
jgi:IS5 family transposase